MGVSKVDYENETLIDLTADTVSEYSLYKGATAHGANGELITGDYRLVSNMVSDSSSGCSSTQLVMNCPFEPSAIAVYYLGAGFTSNLVMDLMVWNINSGITGYYCGHSLGSVSSSKYSIQTHQILLSSYPDKFTWDGSKVYIKSPDSTYTFKGKYRLIAYK